MSASNLPETVDPYEYGVVEAALDYLLNITEEIEGYEILFDEERTHARFMIVIHGKRGSCVGIGDSLMSSSTDAIETFRMGPCTCDEHDLDDEPEAA